ncbi:hypothetical protein [Paraburkholderia sp. J8-2]|uniref:hypothetical protein n=1 Tax=Paraburkholderia sp. J8-2 TaxID=2805440 RepID=UPI002AB66488|nr:hypothetical protein [Paraburkholderia sp. J8-2]
MNAQIIAAQKIGLAVLETIDDTGEQGAPSGVLYAALQAKGASLSQYQSLMEPLVRRKFLELQHDVYTMTDSGRTFMGKLRAQLNALDGKCGAKAAVAT